MKVEIETHKASDFLAKEKAAKLQTLSDTMNDKVLDLFYCLAKKATNPKEIEAFNEKVLSKKLIIKGFL